VEREKDTSRGKVGGMPLRPKERAERKGPVTLRTWPKKGPSVGSLGSKGEGHLELPGGNYSPNIGGGPNPQPSLIKEELLGR